MAAVYNHFPGIAVALRKVAKEIVIETAKEGEQNIKDQIQANGQVDTGFMLSSVYSVTFEGSTYGGSGSPPGDSYLLPEAGPADEITAFVGVGANYGVYQNYGTRYLPARPFFEPGIERTSTSFEAKLSGFEDRLKGSIG